ncbi:hypothetical protein D9611_002449 [Ephemerocybe angulata]|uniref:Uncharacterized protein n=1 Tax=Ephemerocybe angulata TaxID=980116 RepID=A0A8H5C2L8_9AGAR|nr:hypothetical protein D9611_002449 [Tulosesus angulatus]
MVDISESPEPVRERDSSFYVALFAAVLPLWSIVPASWLFVVYTLYTGRIWHFGVSGAVIFSLALCEVFFSVYHYQLASHVAGPSPFTPADTVEIQAAFTRLLKAGMANLPEDGGDEESLFTGRPGSPEEDIIQLDRDDPRAVDFRNCLRTWFCKVRWSDITLHDLQRWVYWSMYNAEMPPYEDLTDSHRRVLDSAIDLLHKRLGCQTENRKDSPLRSMRLTIDPVQIWSRPFLFYALVKTINWYLKRHYRNSYNVRHGRHDGLEYLLRTPSGWDAYSSPRPLVFLHGLGLGLVQYHLTLSHLFQSVTDRPILVILQPHISQDVFHPNFLRPLNRHQFGDRLSNLLKKLDWADMDDYAETTEYEDVDEIKVFKALRAKRYGVTLLSHSNGSYIHAWILKNHPRLAKRSCFVDPVTFCSWEGDVCYNFLYRKPMTGIELLMKYFVGTELGVANLLQRHFDWVSNSLWYEEIPNARDISKTLFVLGGKDAIIDSSRVKKYLTSHGIRKNLCYDPDAKHGQALMSGGPGHTAIFQWLQEPEHH